MTGKGAAWCVTIIFRKDRPMWRVWWCIGARRDRRRRMNRRSEGGSESRLASKKEKPYFCPPGFCHQFSAHRDHGSGSHCLEPRWIFNAPSETNPATALDSSPYIFTARPMLDDSWQKASSELLSGFFSPLKRKGKMRVLERHGEETKHCRQ